VLAPMGLRLSEEKTVITHIDEGFDVLGFHIQRKRKEETQRRTLYTYPSKTSPAEVKAKVRVLTPLSGSTHPHAVDALIQENEQLGDVSSWRAGCVGTRTSVRRCGPRKRTFRKVGTAPRPDPYYWAVDVLEELGAQVRLVNPSGLQWGDRRVKND
jgi:hypothetical protein